MTRAILKASTMTPVVLAAALCAVPAMAQDDAEVTAPQFRVVADWPKALPNEWRVGQVAGVSVGPDDTIRIVQRPRTPSSSAAGATDAMDGLLSRRCRSSCCGPAPGRKRDDSVDGVFDESDENGAGIGFGIEIGDLGFLDRDDGVGEDAIPSPPWQRSSNSRSLKPTVPCRGSAGACRCRPR